MKHPVHARRWIIWGLAVLFYFYEYFLRVAPSVMVRELLASFHIGAGVFGTMTAFYLYAYAPMQIPVGILMDRFGARKLLTLAALACGLSAVLFGVATNIWLANISRFLMGAASAFAFVGMMYISSHWFAGKTLALLMGVGNSIGMMGAVFGEGPLSLLVEAISWRPTMYILGASGLILSFIIFLAVRNEPASMEKHSPQVSEKTPLLHHLKIVTRNSQTWINAIVSLCFYTATVAYGGLWAIPFLVNAHGLSNTTASFAASMIYLGTVIAGPFLGHLSDKTCNRKTWIIITSFLSIVIFMIINYTLSLPTVAVFILMLLLGIMLTGQLLTYTLSVELNPREAKGTALAFTNFLVFLGGSIIQTLAGWLLQFHWDGKTSDGAPVYAASDFQSAMLCFPIAIGIAFIFAFFIKEKRKPWCTHFQSHEMNFFKKLLRLRKPRPTEASDG